jgi:hypothetical protein
VDAKNAHLFFKFEIPPEINCARSFMRQRV